MPANVTELRDRLIDWMAASCPQLLSDDLLLEAFLRFVVKEVLRIAREQRSRP